MATWRRLFGWINDVTAGGKDYDALAAGAIPDPDFFVPVDNANVNQNVNQLTRNQEVRGLRGSVAPIEFRADPRVPFEGNAYALLVKKLVQKWTGATDSRSGTPPAAITHLFEPVQTGELPAVHLAIVRDDHYMKVAGAVLNELSLAFSMGDFAKVSGEFWGKYAKRESGSPPTADYSDYDRRGYLLRDAAVYLAGSGSSLAALSAISFALNNNHSDAIEDRFAQKKNRVVTDYGTPAVKRTVWWPYRHKFLSHAATGSFTLADAVADEDLKLELAHAEQLVFECELEDLGTTPAAKELLRVTAPVIVRTGGGPEQLTDEDSLSSTFEFGMYIDPATQDDFKIEFVDASNVAIT
jgi:hypothetical protein